MRDSGMEKIVLIFMTVSDCDRFIIQEKNKIIHLKYK
jgi:hypothetical protein